jgi:glycosyltransferase involved in cell wall biosynthesis
VAPRTRVLPLQPHCFGFGGFDLQMLAVLRAAQAAGAEVRPMDPWSRDTEFDVLHLWGLDLQHLNVTYWAARAGKKIVVSALLPYPGWRSRARHFASSVVGPARQRRALVDRIQCLAVVNERQAQYATSVLGVPEGRITVIPHIVGDAYFPDAAASASPALPELDISGYAICTGNICARKNQLALIQACRHLKLPLLLVGGTLTGEEAYGRAVAQAVAESPTIRWLRELPADSPQMAAAYRGATLFALPSHVEHQPISALEAAACGKPLLLGRRPYARQPLYGNACLVDPASVDAIIDGLKAVIARPEQFCTPPALLESCRGRNVGRAYADAYAYA